jgi:MFS family permease
MYGLSLLPDLSGLWALIGAVASLAAFVAVELKVKQPLLNIDLIRRNTVFAFSNLAALINYSATFAVGFFVSLYLQYLKGMSPRNAGLILIAQPVVMTIFSPFAGRFSDKVEPRIVASVGMAVSSLGLLLLAFLRADTRLALIIASLAVLGFGFALFSSPNTNAVMGSVEKRFYGVASATLGTMRLVGGALSMGIAMLIFGALVGHVQISTANQGSFLQAVRTGFIIFAALCFAGVFASLARGNRK